MIYHFHNQTQSNKISYCYYKKKYQQTESACAVHYMYKYICTLYKIHVTVDNFCNSGMH